MEWLIFLLVVAAATLFVAWPRAGDTSPGSMDMQDLRAEREVILAELREVEDDALAGRITDDDRRESRRLLGIRLVHVTDALRSLGDDARGPKHGRR
ncbi:MAG: hypothetical protein DWG82_03165 [Chloroflexi bacterium]|nr:hypothetical protein [Chloroflexota bacterium]